MNLIACLETRCFCMHTRAHYIQTHARTTVVHLKPVPGILWLTENLIYFPRETVSDGRRRFSFAHRPSAASPCVSARPELHAVNIRVKQFIVYFWLIENACKNRTHSKHTQPVRRNHAHLHGHIQTSGVGGISEWRALKFFHPCCVRTRMHSINKLCRHVSFRTFRTVQKTKARALAFCWECSYSVMCFCWRFTLHWCVLNTPTHIHKRSQTHSPELIQCALVHSTLFARIVPAKPNIVAVGHVYTCTICESHTYTWCTAAGAHAYACLLGDVWKCSGGRWRRRRRRHALGPEPTIARIMFKWKRRWDPH